MKKEDETKRGRGKPKEEIGKKEKKGREGMNKIRKRKEDGTKERELGK